MASNNRIPLPHLRQPFPNPHPMHAPDPYLPPMHHPPLPRNFPPFETFPPPEVMEQKLSAQHFEIQKLAVENRRLASTHGALRQDLAAAKQELQLRHAHAAETVSEMDQQIRGLKDKISVMEAELKGAEAIKVQLQKAHAEAKGLFDERQDLILKVQSLTSELQRAHAEAMQIPALLSELDGLRQEIHHCRATYDYEKRLFRDHLESLQVMEKNYMAMSSEMEKLRAELTNSSNIDPRTGVVYGGPSAYNESVAAGQYAPAQNAYGVGQHGHSSFTGGGTDGAQANSPHVIAQTGPTNTHTAHDPARGSGQNTYFAGGYDPYGRPVAGYDPLSVQTYSSQIYNNVPNPIGYGHYGAATYDPQNAHFAYDMHRETTAHDVTGANYSTQRTAGYESSSGVSVAPPGQVPMPYGSGPSGNTTGGSMPRSGDQVRK